VTDPGVIRFWTLDRRRARRAALVWGLFLFALTSWPSPPEIPGVSWIPDFDKLGHGLLYGVEGFFLYLAVAWPGPPRFSLARALAVGGALAVWGTIDEVHQAWIPGRFMDPLDALLDATGGYFGALAASRLSISPRFSRTSRPAGPESPARSPTATGS
jgi:VanZ family protein